MVIEGVSQLGIPLPQMSENPFRRTDQIRTASLLSGEANNDGSSISQSYLRSDLRPTRQRRALQMKRHAPKAHRSE
jgi:hypothetical protein